MLRPPIRGKRPFRKLRSGFSGGGACCRDLKKSQAASSQALASSWCRFFPLALALLLCDGVGLGEILGGGDTDRDEAEEEEAHYDSSKIVGLVTPCPTSSSASSSSSAGTTDP
ncbi:hypothetical protein PoB_003676200 [Plakobranchus ocellatus]|uniref:Uncharacterized protein n=1 Tax=Plakobranchus ocellatus TaxID=259542 RepID=A0AAV4ATG2_9GAST|nr:hypothetical protein PoB_003676200 [Plakobranchus ocellatus]